MTTIEIGNIGSKEQVEKLMLKLNGKTYMNFNVGYGVYAGNYPTTISTESNVTESELKDMVIFYLSCEI